MQKREMKRSCYMEAAKALHECLRTITGLLDPNRKVIDISAEYARLSAPLASAQVVAGMPLCEALMALSQFMLLLQSRLLSIRRELDPLHSRYQFLDALIGKSQISIDANLEEQKRFNIEGLQDRSRWDALRYQFGFQQSQQQQLTEDQRDVGQQAQAHLNKMAEVLVDEMQSYPPLITEALKCVRSELGFSFDEGTYLKSMQEAGAIAKTTIRAALNQMAADLPKNEEP